MGGIAGIFNADGRPADPGILRAMTDVIAYRGPTGDGHFLDGPAALGHRRLPIIELGPQGRQPISSDDGTISMACNGRLLNYVELAADLGARGHRFRSRSDIEVMLRAYEEWGTSCLQKFVGMYALAIWDSRRQRLVCARDRVGIKPFFYHYDGKRFLGGSEIKQILVDPTIPRDPNEDLIADYLVGNYYLAEPTFFRGIRRLPPGHYLTVDRQGLSIIRYWDLDPANKIRYPKDEDYAHAFLDLFQDVLKAHLRSDVTVSSALTGGLDSSTIVTLVERIRRREQLPIERLDTYSYIFGDETVDEDGMIEAVVRRTHTRRNDIRLDPNEVFPCLEEAIWHQDEPSRDIALPIVWLKMKSLRERGVRVLLGGVGADDILSGRLFYLADLLREGRLIALLDELRFYGRNTYGEPQSRLRVFLEYALRPIVPRPIKVLFRSVSRASLPPWIRSDYARARRLGARPPESPPRRFDALYDQKMYEVLTREFTPFLLNNLEMNAAAFGIENRLPYMDARLIEFLFAIPREQKLARRVPKIVQRNAMKGILPDEIVTKVKPPIQPLLSHWMRVTFRNAIESAIGSEQLRARGYIDVDTLRRLYREYCERGYASGIPAHRMNTLVWGIVNLEGWFRCVCERPRQTVGV